MKNVKAIILEAVHTHTHTHTHTSNLIKNKKALKVCFINIADKDVN